MRRQAYPRRLQHQRRGLVLAFVSEEDKNGWVTLTSAEDQYLETKSHTKDGWFPKGEELRVNANLLEDLGPYRG